MGEGEGWRGVARGRLGRGVLSGVKNMTLARFCNSLPPPNRPAHTPPTRRIPEYLQLTWVRLGLLFESVRSNQTAKPYLQDNGLPVFVAFIRLLPGPNLIQHEYDADPTLV